MDDKKIEQIVKAVRESLKSNENGVRKDVSYKKGNISLSAAKSLAEAVEKEAARIGVRPVIAVANSGANIILVHASDDSYIASFDVAVSKAYTSVALKMTTKALSSLASPGGSLYGIELTAPGKIAIFGGGDPLYFSGELVGGLGVSGGTEEEDTYLSSFGAGFFKEA